MMNIMPYPINVRHPSVARLCLQPVSMVTAQPSSFTAKVKLRHNRQNDI